MNSLQVINDVEKYDPVLFDFFDNTPNLKFDSLRYGMLSLQIQFSHPRNCLEKLVKVII